MKTANTILYAAVLGCMISCSEAGNIPDIIPEPESISVKSGRFVIDGDIRIICSSQELAPAAEYLSDILYKATEYQAHIEKEGSSGIILESTVSGEGGDGAYTIDAGRRTVRISGNGYSGVVNGIATFRQLLTVDDVKDVSIPCCRITDAPRFAWRGIMLDVARHFFTKEEVMTLLDAMSLYKMNRFHWHLTDDQGWRVEIKKYPELAEKGGWRHFDKNDRKCIATAADEMTDNFRIPEDRLRISGRDTLYGGSYTQEDIREIVEYASVRGIDIIPEIDMPGHMLAAITNYPELACGQDLSWGEYFSCPICPGKDSVLEFCKDIYSEIFSLFPGEYIHIGGDEVNQSNWETCPACLRRMKEHGLRSTSELQSWFTHEMERFFNEHGKKLICWDEGVAGGLSETATVMWWRSWSPDPVVESAAGGTQIIACPNATFYLDYAQDGKSMKNIYDFDRSIDEMFGNAAGAVAGVQGNLWTERVPSYERMTYMIFPRLLAIAELGWSSPESRSFEDFSTRTASHFRKLDDMGIEYRIPEIEGFHDVNSFVDSVYLRLGCQDSSARIFYTTDGSIPDMSSTEYTGPVKITESTAFTLRTFGKGGRQGETVRTEFRKEDFSQPADTCAETPGLTAEWYGYSGNSCSEIETAPHNGTYTIEDIFIPEGVSGNIGLIIKGFINIPEDGIYTFRLFSDDGSLLKIDGVTVVDNDGAHSPYEKSGQRALGKGLHPLEVRYFDHNGGLLEMKVCGSDGSVLAPAALYRKL